MNTFRADLHCHTTCSDGTKTPEEIVRMAKEIGLAGLSITDHDSIEAYSFIVPLAKELGISLISGVEFSTVHNGVSVHILGYSFPLDSPLINAFCEKHRLRRLDRNQMILERLAAHKMPITQAELEACLHQAHPGMKNTIGRPHIAQALIQKGYVSSIQEAFNKYLGDNKSCYAPGQSFSTQETIDLIHGAKGLAVIAHPHLVNDIPTLRALMKLNFDGIECFYAKFPLIQQKPWLEIAQKHNWLVTGGSDYHGTIKPNLNLGSSFVQEEAFCLLEQHFIKNNP